MSSLKIRQSRAFTLIELLVVIVIIGILATLATVALSSARLKARDIRRVGDVKQIQTALELYYSEEQVYPEAINFGAPLIGANTGHTYMAKVPVATMPVDGSCLTADYDYVRLNGSKGFAIYFCLGSGTGELAAGDHLLTGNGYESGNIATYLDAPVSGLDYNSPSFSGVTYQGKFAYKSGEFTVYKFGNYTLGSINGNNISSDRIVFVPETVGLARTATDRPKVLAISHFLLSLKSNAGSELIVLDASKKALATSSVDIPNDFGNNRDALDSVILGASSGELKVAPSSASDNELAAMLETARNSIGSGSYQPVADYTLSYDAGPGGTITGVSSQTVSAGSSGSPVIAVPDANYTFSSWSDGVMTASRTDTDVTDNISVTANFNAPNTYTLNYTAGIGGTISGTTTQTVIAGLDGSEVTAVPDSGYRFNDWSDGVMTAARTETAVDTNKELTANFIVVDCNPGQYLVGGAPPCVNVGSGYYSSAGNDRTACPSNTHTISETASSIADCLLNCISDCASAYRCAGDTDNCGNVCVSNAPSAPNVTGLAVASADTSASLSWTAVPGASGYNVCQSTTANACTNNFTASYANVATNAKSVTGLAGTNTYYYTVKAKICSGNAISAAPSNEAIKRPACYGASGGTATVFGSYTLRTFTANGTFAVDVTCPAATLVVAAGGTGGGRGGGGAGGVLYNANDSISPGSYGVTIGQGVAGANGQNSVFGGRTAIGGGLGGSWSSTNGTAGAAGGSGGGGGTGTNGTSNGGAGTSGQGYVGGNGNFSNTPPTAKDGGGGGGAGGAGQHGAVSARKGGIGGIGINLSAAFGTSVGISGWFAGGGGGSCNDVGSCVGGPATSGGGTGGAYGESQSTISANVAGTANTGGGGGAGNSSVTGGSGVVIIKYLTPTP